MPVLAKDRIGQKFGGLTVLECVGRKGGPHNYFLCRCDCGNTKEVLGLNLFRGGHTTSCGCFAIKLRTKHGQAKGKRTSVYDTWLSVKRRCLNKKSIEYPNYGGRGIQMFSQWVNSFADFYAYVGDKPTKNHSLDRWPNNDGNYEPGNVRWATNGEQSRNKRSNVYVEYNGKRMIISDWAKLFSVSQQTFHRMLKKTSLEECMKFYEQPFHKRIKGHKGEKLKQYMDTTKPKIDSLNSK
jgi:hypothetical protein